MRELACDRTLGRHSRAACSQAARSEAELALLGELCMSMGSPLSNIAQRYTTELAL